MQQRYAERVADNGASDLLVQRALRDFGHCAFSQDEWTTAFADLVVWVEDGVRPAGDDVFDTSAADYGCQFAMPYRNPFGLGIPVCP